MSLPLTEPSDHNHHHQQQQQQQRWRANSGYDQRQHFIRRLRLIEIDDLSAGTTQRRRRRRSLSAESIVSGDGGAVMLSAYIRR